MKGDIFMSVKTQTITSLAPESAPLLRVGLVTLGRGGETATDVAPSPKSHQAPSPPALSPADQDWLTEQLARLEPWEDDEANDTRTEKDDELPESATFEEAIELFLADKCSLGRAAELAGVTRWDIQDVLYERGTPVQIYSDKSVEEMDELADRLESRCLLCS